MMRAGLIIFLLCPTLLIAAPCESIKSLPLANTTVTLAQTVPPGSFSAPGGRGADTYKSVPAFCRVAATLTPVADSEIKIEVWLPESGWNGGSYRATESPSGRARQHAAVVAVPWKMEIGCESRKDIPDFGIQIALCAF